MKNHSSIYKENYLYDNLKIETFELTQGTLRTKRTTKTHNSKNWLELSGISYFGIIEKSFQYQENVNLIL